MAVHLLGGGWQEDERAWTGRFVADATAHASGDPRIVVVLWHEDRAEAESWADDYRDDLSKLGPCTVDVVALGQGDVLDPALLTGVDGIFVGGGVTPGYHAAVMPAADTIRALLAGGVAYAGFSAGAMIAGRQALLGGWLRDAVPVCPDNVNEGLDEVTLAPGLGLVDLVVDVHGAQRGTLGRAVAVVAGGLAERTVCIDEDTSLIVDGAGLQVAGLGRALVVDSSTDGARITMLRGADEDADHPQPMVD